MSQGPVLLSRPTHWYESPEAVHENASRRFDLSFQSSDPHPRPRPLPHPRRQPTRNFLSSSPDPHIRTPAQDVPGPSAMPAAAPFNTPPSLLRRSLYEDPAFAGDPDLNPHAWERQGTAIPPDPSYDVPFAGGFPRPASRSRNPSLPTHPQPSKPPLHSSLTSSSAASSASHLSAPAPPSATSSRFEGLSYLRDDVLSPYFYDPNNAHDNPTSTSSLPAFGDSVDGHSTSSSSTLNTPGSHSDHRDAPPADSKPTPVVRPSEPALQPSLVEQPPKVHKPTTRPPPNDLDSIDELDESNPYGVGIHHNGPYEAIAAALGTAPKPTDGVISASGRKRGPRDGGAPVPPRSRGHKTATSDPANPLVLNLKPGQILEHSIFQPPTGPPLPLERSPATYPPDTRFSPPHAHGYVLSGGDPAFRGNDPSVLRRNQSRGPPGLSQIPLGSQPRPQNGKEPQRANPLATVPRRPPPLHRPSSLLDPPNVSDYPATSRQRQNPSYDIDPPVPPLERHPRDGFFGQSQSSQVFDPVPTPKSAPSTATQQQPFSHYRESPPGVPPSSSRSPPPAPAPARHRNVSGPSVPVATHRRYEAPSETLGNLNLNGNSPPPPDIHRPPPSVMSSATQTGLAPRHIPRRLVMPTPLAPSPETVPTTPPYQQQVHQQPYSQQPYSQQPPPPQPYQQIPPPARRHDQNVRFASPSPQPPVHASTIAMHDEGARNLLRKRSAPAAPPSHRGGILSLLFGRHDRKPEMAEMRPGSRQEMAGVRGVGYRPGTDPDALPGPARRANTLREEPKPKRTLTKQRR